MALSPAELFTVAFTVEEFCPALLVAPAADSGNRHSNPTLKGSISITLFQPRRDIPLTSDLIQNKGLGLGTVLLHVAEMDRQARSTSTKLVSVVAEGGNFV